MKTVYPGHPVMRPFSACSKILLLTVIIISCLLTGSAQSYYPGGLSNSNLIVWLNAGNSASITQTAGKVSLWGELSGHAYNFSQSTAARQPSYTATGGPSSRPAISFTASGLNYLSRSSMNAALSYTGGVSSFAAASFNASPTSAGYERIYDFGNGQSSDNIWMGRQGTGANIGYESRNGGTMAQSYTTSNAVVNSSNNIYEVIQQGGAVTTLSAVAFYQAGTVQASTGTSGSTSYVPNTLSRTVDYIGRSNWTVDDYFSGTMSEILFYNTAMNTTRRRILENYLSAAWGLAVSNTYYTPPTTTSYYSNLVGIGYTSSTDNFLADVSGSTDGLGFSSGTGATGFLNTAGYVMAAHNQQGSTINTAVAITGIGSNLNKWNRSWNMQKTGGNSTGLITLNFNFSDYNGTTPNSTYSYGLLYNATDGSFATGTNKLITLSSTSVAGNIVSLTAAANNLLGGYYTLVWSTVVVLPVGLSSFTATRQSANSFLQWTISTDINLSYVQVQRSTDATRFAALGILPKTASGLYAFTDSNPANGVNYYRLKMMGVDSVATYSAICAVDFGNHAGTGWTVYPNPVANVLHIVCSAGDGNLAIRVINSNGSVVRLVRQAALGMVAISLQDLPRGVYTVEISNDKRVAVQKIIR